MSMVSLLKIGYNPDDIEEKFIPIMILRHHFGVGHVFLKLFKQRQLNALHHYLESRELDFRDLLKQVIKKVKEGHYVLKPDPDLSMRGDALRRWKKLISIFKKSHKKSRPQP